MTGKPAVQPRPRHFEDALARPAFGIRLRGGEHGERDGHGHDIGTLRVLVPLAEFLHQRSQSGPEGLDLARRGERPDAPGDEGGLPARLDDVHRLAVDLVDRGERVVEHEPCVSARPGCPEICPQTSGL